MFFWLGMSCCLFGSGRVVVCLARGELLFVWLVSELLFVWLGASCCLFGYGRVVVCLASE